MIEPTSGETNTKCFRNKAHTPSPPCGNIENINFQFRISVMKVKNMGHLQVKGVYTIISLISIRQRVLKLMSISTCFPNELIFERVRFKMKISHNTINHFDK